VNRTTREVMMKLWNSGQDWNVTEEVRADLNILGLHVYEDVNGWTRPYDPSLETYRVRLRELFPEGIQT
jgi:hypothetical protein